MSIAITAWHQQQQHQKSSIAHRTLNHHLNFSLTHWNAFFLTFLFSFVSLGFLSENCNALHWTLLVSVQYRVRLFSFVKKLFRFFFSRTVLAAFVVVVVIVVLVPNFIRSSFVEKQLRTRRSSNDKKISSNRLD